MGGGRRERAWWMDGADGFHVVIKTAAGRHRPRGRRSSDERPTATAIEAATATATAEEAEEAAIGR